MIRIALIGCSKSKQGQNTPSKAFLAKDIYTGRNYKKARDQGVARFQCVDYYILSAEHYLLDKNKLICYYDKSLYEMKEAECRKWAGKVLAELKSRFDLNETEFIIFAGSIYAKYLINELHCITLKYKGRHITFDIKARY